MIRTGEGDSWVDSGAGADNVTTLDRADLSRPPTPSRRAWPAVPAPTSSRSATARTRSPATARSPSPGGPTVKLAPAKPAQHRLAGAVDVGSLNDSAMANVDTPRRHHGGIGQRPDRGRARRGAPVRQRWRRHHRHRQRQPSRRLGRHQGRHDRGVRRPGGALPRHDSVLVGGAGGDSIKSGSANDKVYTGSDVNDDSARATTTSGRRSTDDNTVDTGAGSDTVYGSNAIDFVTTHSTPAQKAIVYGGAGADVLTGGLGSDEIYGGPGNDYVVAAPATVGDPGSAEDALGRLASSASCRVPATAPSCSSAAPAATASTAPTDRRRSSATPRRTPAACSRIR